MRPWEFGWDKNVFPLFRHEVFKFELTKLYVLLSIVFVLCSVCSSGQSGDDVGLAFVVWLHMVWSMCIVLCQKTCVCLLFVTL